MSKYGYLRKYRGLLYAVREVRLGSTCWPMETPDGQEIFDGTMYNALHNLKFLRALKVAQITSYSHTGSLGDEEYIARVQAEVKKIFARRSRIELVKVEVVLRSDDCPQWRYMSVGRNHITIGVNELETRKH
jgi:hypothetical protein